MLSLIEASRRMAIEGDRRFNARTDDAGPGYVCALTRRVARAT